MGTHLSFNMPICSGSDKNFLPRAASFFDGYFCFFGGHKYQVIGREEIDNKNYIVQKTDYKKNHPLITALKVASLLTVIIPLVMFVGKVIVRMLGNFKLQQPSSEADTLNIQSGLNNSSSHIANRDSVEKISEDNLLQDRSNNWDVDEIYLENRSLCLQSYFIEEISPNNIEKTLKKRISEFLELGGIIQPKIDVKLENEEVIVSRPIILDQNKSVYPVCHSGSNRSQLLYQILVERFPEQELVNLPHGVAGGADFWYIPQGIDDETILGYATFNYEEIGQKDELTGFERVDRFGDQKIKEEREKNSNYCRMVDGWYLVRTQALEEQEEMRQWMTDHYFLKIIEEGGQILGAYRGFHGMLDRLVSTAREKGKRLDGVVLFPIDMIDPVTNGRVGEVSDKLKEMIQVI